MNEEELLKKYKKLVRYYAYSKRGRNVDIDDLVQEGFLGLVIASRKYDESKGSRFTTYATTWINSKILRAIYNQSRTIRLSVPFWESYFKIINKKNELKIKFNREPSISEIANSLGISDLKVQEILMSYDQTTVTNLDMVDIDSKYYSKLVNEYLYENDNLDEDDISLDIFVKDNHGTPENIFNEKFDKEYLSLKIKKLFIDCNLTEREIEVLMLKYGFDRTPMKLRQIADIYGVSQQRISQNLESAFDKIRCSGLISSVDTFLDSYDDVYYNLEEKAKKLKK